jgi:N-acetylglucosamine-6-phosphate deacetylase
MKAFTNASIFTGDSMVSNKALLVDGEMIVDLVDKAAIPGHAEICDMDADIIAPAFIDVQLYGGNGLLFSEFPSIESLTATVDYSRRGGALQILPTIATHALEKIFEAIDAVSEYQRLKLPGVLGLHIEGPFINPVKKGAHAEQYIVKPTMKHVKQLIERGKGIIKIITLAPEMCSDEVISYLLASDVVVSAGHSNATYDQAMHAFGKGIHTATHLFNAMSAFQHRAPGLVGAILDSADVMCSVVADGYHVDFAALRIAKQVMKERIFLITDAVTENNTGLYTHHFVDEKYVIADGTLSGSALTMAKAVKNCVEKINISLEESLRMASLYPAQVLGLDKERGKLQKNYRAEFLRLNGSLDVKAMYESGRLTVFNAP